VGALLEAGVTFFLDLTEEGELNPYSGLLAQEPEGCDRPLEHRRLSIRDFDVPSRDHMVRILDTIDAALEAGHTVYLHCWGGTGRTGTVVGCHLARHGKPGEQALAGIVRLRRNIKNARMSPETPAQREMVLGWPEGD
jgi:protein-tyrosine phosphatase